MKKIFILFSAIIFSLNVFSQAPNWLWAKRMGAPLTGDAGTSIVVDAIGNVYTTGAFQGTVDFDPGPGIFNLTSTGVFDIFVCKLDASGNFIWAKAMGGILFGARGYSIAIDTAGIGDIYLTGIFEGTADFDPGIGTFNLTAVGGNDIFILKLDTAGNFIWAKTIGGSGLDYTDSGNSIALDPGGSGDVYTAGYFVDTVDFDPSVGVFNLTSTDTGTYDIFILKLDSSGNFVWAKQMGGLSDDRATSITLDALANVYTTGIFRNTADFDPGAGTFNLTTTSASNYDIFISKLDSSGNFLWAKQFSGTSYKYGYSVALAPNGNVYSTGSFWGTVDFDPGIGIYNLNTPVLYSGVYVSKLDSSGNFLWAKHMSGIGTSGGGIGKAIALDAYGNSYTSGYFAGMLDFDPGTGIDSVVSAGFEDVFICKLDSLGNFIWAIKADGPGSDFLTSLALDIYSNAHITGFFAGPSITFGSTVLANADSTNSYGIYLLQNLIPPLYQEIMR